jgi:hypothetical protein
MLCRRVPAAAVGFFGGQGGLLLQQWKAATWVFFATHLYTQSFLGIALVCVGCCLSCWTLVELMLCRKIYFAHMLRCIVLLGVAAAEVDGLSLVHGCLRDCSRALFVSLCKGE